MNPIVKSVNKTLLAYSTAMWLACVLVAANAFAEDQVRSETVRFADLNVGTEAGAKALYGRIHAAAERVCPDADRAQLGAMARAKACMKKAESQAIAKVNLPLLTAYYQKISGGHVDSLIANR